MKLINKILKNLSIVFIAMMMIFGGYNHFVNPSFYNELIPNFLPKLLVNYFSGGVEAVIGVCILLPRFRAVALLVFTFLMTVFLPLHIWDFFKDTPAIGTKEVALVRIIIQFLFIYLGFRLYKVSRK